MTFEHLALASVCVACLSVGLLAGIWLATPRPRIPAHPVLHRHTTERPRLHVIDGGRPYDWSKEMGG